MIMIHIVIHHDAPNAVKFQLHGWELPTFESQKYSQKAAHLQYLPVNLCGLIILNHFGPPILCLMEGKNKQVRIWPGHGKDQVYNLWLLHYHLHMHVHTDVLDAPPLNIHSHLHAYLMLDYSMSTCTNSPNTCDSATVCNKFRDIYITLITRKMYIQ